MFLKIGIVMSLKTALGFGIAAVVAYKLYNTKRFTAAAKFTFDKLDFNWKKKQIFITLSALNPTSSSLTIKSIVGTLSVNNTDVATIENFENRKVLPNTRSSIKLTLTPTASGILSVLVKFVKEKLKGAKKTTATFDGSANVNGLNIPIKTKLL